MIYCKTKMKDGRNLEWILHKHTNSNLPLQYFLQISIFSFRFNLHYTPYVSTTTTQRFSFVNMVDNISIKNTMVQHYVLY